MSAEWYSNGVQNVVVVGSLERWGGGCSTTWSAVEGIVDSARRHGVAVVS